MHLDSEWIFGRLRKWNDYFSIRCDQHLEGEADSVSILRGEKKEIVGWNTGIPDYCAFLKHTNLNSPGRGSMAGKLRL